MYCGHGIDWCAGCACVCCKKVSLEALFNIYLCVYVVVVVCVCVMYAHEYVGVHSHACVYIGHSRKLVSSYVHLTLLPSDKVSH